MMIPDKRVRIPLSLPTHKKSVHHSETIGSFANAGIMRHHFHEEGKHGVLLWEGWKTKK